MKLKFEVKLDGLKEGKERVLNKYKSILMKSMFKMEELAISRAPFDTGFLRQRITLFPQVLAKEYVLRSAAGYSEDLEYGNNPRMVKFGDILKWVERKGIRTAEEGQYAFAKYVTKKIRTEGVNPHPFLRPSLHEVREIWYPAIAKAEMGSD